MTKGINEFIERYNEFAEEYSGKKLASDVRIISSASPAMIFATVPWLKIMIIALCVGAILGLIMTPAGVRIREAMAVKKAQKAATAAAAQNEDNATVSENTDSKVSK